MGIVNDDFLFSSNDTYKNKPLVYIEIVIQKIWTIHCKITIVHWVVGYYLQVISIGQIDLYYTAENSNVVLDERTHRLFDDIQDDKITTHLLLATCETNSN